MITYLIVQSMIFLLMYEFFHAFNKFSCNFLIFLMNKKITKSRVLFFLFSFKLGIQQG